MSSEEEIEHVDQEENEDRFDKNIESISRITAQSIAVTIEEDENGCSDNPPAGISSRRRRRVANPRVRKVSLFSVDQHALERKRRSMVGEVKGEFSIDHYDKSKNQLRQEMSYGYFEQSNTPIPKYKRSVASLFSDSRASYKNSLVPIEKEERRYEVDPTIPFDVLKVKQIIRDEFDILKDRPYFDHTTVCKDLSNTVKERVKDVGFTRYKYIVLVSVGNDANQGLNISSRSFWDTERDSYVSESLKLGGSFVVVNVYAIYFS